MQDCLCLWEKVCIYSFRKDQRQYIAVCLSKMGRPFETFMLRQLTVILIASGTAFLTKGAAMFGEKVEYKLFWHPPPAFQLNFFGFVHPFEVDSFNHLYEMPSIYVMKSKNVQCECQSGAKGGASFAHRTSHSGGHLLHQLQHCSWMEICKSHIHHLCVLYEKTV